MRYCEMKFFKFTLINNLVTDAVEISLDQVNESLPISWDDPNKRYFSTVVSSAIIPNKEWLFNYGQQQYNDYLKRPYPIAILEKR